MDKVGQGLVCGIFSGDVCCADEGSALFLVEGKRGGIGLVEFILMYITLTHPHTHPHPSNRTENSVKLLYVRWNGEESSFGVGKFSTVEDLLDHFESKPVIGGESGTSGDT